MRRFKLTCFILLSFMLFFSFSFQDDSLVSATTEPLESGTSQTASGEGTLTITPIQETGSHQIHSGTNEETNANGLQSGTTNEVLGKALVTIEQTDSSFKQSSVEESELETGTSNQIEGSGIVSSSNSLSSPYSRVTIGAMIHSELNYDVKKKQWVHSFRVVATTGKPTKVTYSSKILTKTKKNGKESTYKTTSKTFIGKELKVGYTYKKYYKPKTAFLRLKDNLKIYKGPLLVSDTWNTNNSLLLNKKAERFPDYYDKPSNKRASNISTNWKIPATTIKRGNLTKIREQYEKKYKVKLNWSKDQIELHHIKPVMYGGSSKLGNYMAIPKDKHQRITSWFSNY